VVIYSSTTFGRDIPPTKNSAGMSPIGGSGWECQNLFTLKAKGKISVLSGPGEWVLKSTYHSPELKNDKKIIVDSLGCTAPDMQVQSDPVTITVLNSSK
jgi:hypothetical protein